MKGWRKQLLYFFLMLPLMTPSYNLSCASEINTEKIYRIVNLQTGDRVYTNDKSKCEKLEDTGWTYEGIGWYAVSMSSTPVYSLLNPANDFHQYTADKKEKERLLLNGWKDEGVGWYSSDTKDIPIYSQQRYESHNYTGNIDEANKLNSLGWEYNGIAWYGAYVAKEDRETNSQKIEADRTIGNLSVASVGIKIDLYSGFSQTIIDDENVAAAFSFDNVTTIADHDSQSFKNLQKIKTNDSAEVTIFNDTTVYKCIGGYRGINTKQNLLIEGKSAAAYKPHTDLIMYTCLDENGAVWITLWQKENR